MGPLVTVKTNRQLIAASAAALRAGGAVEIRCSLDLDRSLAAVVVDASGWTWDGGRYPHLHDCKDRTVYAWNGTAFEPVARYSGSLFKLVPTEWGAPTFEIDGIKMLPTARVSPYEDAKRKVALVEPRGKAILDTCGGLGYFAAWCLAGGAASIRSFEKHPDVLWLRSLNPWSPPADPRLNLTLGDVAAGLQGLPDAAFDAVLHDPPRFGIAGELYSQAFYDGLWRVLRPGGRLFHYTGTPNRLTSGRDVPLEVAKRLTQSGFAVERAGDGLLAVRRSRSSGRR